MIANSPTPSSRPAPFWLTATALGGVAWNIFGIVQFAGSVSATEAGLIASGLTPEQAVVMTGYPDWMTAAFAVGVFGGLAGSVLLLLLLRRAVAMPTLSVSLVAYVALWLGDAVHGIFAALGAQQVTILSLVVALAAALCAVSRHPAAKA